MIGYGQSINIGNKFHNDLLRNGILMNKIKIEQSLNIRPVSYNAKIEKFLDYNYLKLIHKENTLLKLLPIVLKYCQLTNFHRTFLHYYHNYLLR